MTLEEKQRFWLLSVSRNYLGQCEDYLKLLNLSPFSKCFGTQQEIPIDEKHILEALFEAAVVAYRNVFSQHKGIKPEIRSKFISDVEGIIPDPYKDVHVEIKSARDTFVAHSDHKLSVTDSDGVKKPAIKVLRKREGDYYKYGISSFTPSSEKVDQYIGLVTSLKGTLDEWLRPIRQSLNKINPEMSCCYLDTSASSNVWLQGINEGPCRLGKS